MKTNSVTDYSTGTILHPFTENFTFRLVMRDESICRGMLERILPDVDFGEMKLNNEEIFNNDDALKNFIFSIETEKALDFDPDAHGVRFDVLVKSSKKWTEIEMQTYTGEHIGRRARYYQANMDMDAFSKGVKYKNLTPTYTIFICTFDYIGEGKAVYFFQHFDVKNNLPLDDEAYIIILNTKCDLKIVPDQLKPLYAYINNPNQISDDFIRKVNQKVMEYNSGEWRRVQMTLKEALDNKKTEGGLDMQQKIAKNMIAEGMEIEQIARVTGLSQEDVLQLVEGE
ncbi:MAG: Rpn family recombination-promoting nuclease/putative transposase [Firmicutes bacterium]|nr:Rpn family recombination-promoting nuclease/putative transposase [Bacillota bacterium]